MKASYSHKAHTNGAFLLFSLETVGMYEYMEDKNRWKVLGIQPSCEMGLGSLHWEETNLSLLCTY